MKNKSSALAAAPLLAAALAAGAPAQAQMANSGWQLEAAVYGWFPAIRGDISFPAGGGSSIDMSTGDVLDVLKFAFFTAVQARHGEWGLFTDIAYADLGDNGRINANVPVGPVSIPVSLDADLDIKTWIWTVAGTYQLKNDNDGTMDVLFGARMLDMTDRLKWSNVSADILGGVPIDLSGTSKAHTTNWDAVVGLRGRAYLGGDRKWFVPYHADIGAGQSQLTWQVNAGVGYQFDWGALVGSWRHLSYKFKSGSLIDSQSFSGPLVGMVVKF